MVTIPPRRELAKRAAMAVPPVRRLIDQRDRALYREQYLSSRLAQLETMQPRYGSATATATSSRSELTYLFIVTYGRSGSTLLQGVLNSIPEYLIRGETRDALHKLFLYQSTILREKRRWSSSYRGPDSPWFGITHYPEELAILRIRSLLVDSLLRPSGDTRVTGLKEIEWWHDDWEQYFAFLDQVFPGMRVVINTRDHTEVIKSKWWAEMERADALKLLDAHEERLNNIADRMGDRAFRVHYDRWVADPSSLKGLFGWLQEPFDRHSIDSVLSVRHSLVSRPGTAGRAGEPGLPTRELCLT